MTENFNILSDEKLFSFIAFKARHLNEDIEGIELYEERFGKDKVRTIHVLLVLCLHLAVDPPDVLSKISPCAKLEAWYDPREKNLTRALETIGKNLQVQYERWQPKARYKQSLDPTIEEVHRFCHSLRRSARDERVLFHYNGHGVPRPTENGEIWVFNKAHTKYIPLSLYDLQTWMAGPSVYVFDCNNAERIIKMMASFANRRQDGVNNTNGNSGFSMDQNIILAACEENQDTPQNPEVPADLFTACLTTPIKTALHWYVWRHRELFPNYLDESMLDMISGTPSNRISMFGEINWVFTAVTDTIAWSCLPPQLFQKLFRQDLLVASLFRNFLLAERIMHYYGVRPVSYPALPSTHLHPMWSAWDHALDEYVSQLPEILQHKQAQTHANNNWDNLPIIVDNSSSQDNPYDNPFSICICPPNDQMCFCAAASSNVYLTGHSSDEEEEYNEDDETEIIEKRMIPRNMLLDDELGNFLDLQYSKLVKNESNLLDNKVTNIPRKNNLRQQQPNNANLSNQVNPTRKQFTNNHLAMRRNPSINGQISKPAHLSNQYHQIDMKNPLNGPSADIVPFRHSEFFNDHMTAFELWLKTADSKKPMPLQLPILLQVLLSQVHRFRALRLISEYMDLGPWAVINCLTVGIFPYVVRLLQSPVSDVKPYLVFIWGKIISSAQTDFAKNDVVKDAGYKYFVSCLTGNEQFEIIIKTIATFTLAKMLINNPNAQKLYMNQNFMTVLIEELDNNPPDLSNINFIRLRIWFILCFAKLWSDNDQAKWYGVRQNIHEKLLKYLKDINPEVRAATVYALGTFLNNRSPDGVRSKHAIQVDQGICQHMLTTNSVVHDSSPLVRTELVVAMRYMVQLFGHQLISVAACYTTEAQLSNHSLQQQQPPTTVAMVTAGATTNQQQSLQQQIYTKHGAYFAPPSPLPVVNANKVRHGSFDLQPRQNAARFMQSSSMVTSLPITNIYTQMYTSLLVLANDPHPKVYELANIILDAIKNYGKNTAEVDSQSDYKENQPQRNGEISKSPNRNMGLEMPHSAKYATYRHKVDNNVKLVSSEKNQDDQLNLDLNGLSSDFFNWSCRYFTQPLLPKHRLISSNQNVGDGASSSISSPRVLLQQQLSSQINNQPLQQPTSVSRHTHHSHLPNLCLINEPHTNSIIRQKYGNQSTAPAQLMHAIDSAHYEDKRRGMQQQAQLMAQGHKSWNATLASTTGHMLSQIFLQKLESRSELLKFHPYRNFLAVADKSGVSLWNWEKSQRAQHLFPPCVPSTNETASLQDNLCRSITTIQFINCQEENGGMLLVGTMDSKIRIWRNYLRDLGQDPEIVTAWCGLTDQICSQQPSGLISHWHQNSGELTLSGDVKYVRLWDSQQESKIQDYPTNLDSNVTCLDRSWDGRLIFAGFGDGHVKMFDTRSSESALAPASSDNLTWQYTIGYNEANLQVTTVSSHGDLVTWELRNAAQPLSITMTTGSATNTNVPTNKILGISKRPQPIALVKANTASSPNNLSRLSQAAHNREGLLKSTTNQKLTLTSGKIGLAKKYNFNMQINTVLCADLRVNSSNEKHHLAILGQSSAPPTAHHHANPGGAGGGMSALLSSLGGGGGNSPVAQVSQSSSNGVVSILTNSGEITSIFKFHEGFSRANIDCPVSLAIHPYQNVVALALEDQHLMMLRLQPK